MVYVNIVHISYLQDMKIQIYMQTIITHIVQQFHFGIDLIG